MPQSITPAGIELNPITEPIDEPIASCGPFVMNTNDEIRQTIDDFNNGKFGYLD